MNLKRTLSITVVLFAVCFSNYSLRAEEGDGELPPIRKLSRGLVNMVTGPLEVIIHMLDVNEEEGGFAAVTYGVLKGICYTVAREVIGITEVVTFLIPFPGATDDPRDSGWGYGPLMKPEWVVDEEHDWYNFVYPNYPPE